MKFTVENLRINYRNFTANIEVDGALLAINGRFRVEFDGQYPEIQVNTLGLSDSLMDVNLYEIIDLPDLEQQIKDTDTGEWYNEHVADREEYMRGEER